MYCDPERSSAAFFDPEGSRIEWEGAADFFFGARFLGAGRFGAGFSESSAVGAGRFDGTVGAGWDNSAAGPGADVSKPFCAGVDFVDFLAAGP
jgi:hypothetical protein